MVFSDIIVLMSKHKIKRRSNRLFSRNEHKILYAFLRLLRFHYGYITAREIAEASGLSRQTIYNHHPNLDQAVMKCEEELLHDFSLELDIAIKKFSRMIPDRNKRIFYYTLIFMDRYSDIFSLVCADINNQGLLHQVVREVYPRLQLQWLPVGTPAPDILSERVSMYMRMLVEVISRWGIETHCNIRNADRYIERMMRVTEAAERNKLP